jgi:hypothetical protein
MAAGAGVQQHVSEEEELSVQYRSRWGLLGREGFQLEQREWIRIQRSAEFEVLVVHHQHAVSGERGEMLRDENRYKKQEKRSRSGSNEQQPLS